VAVINLEGRADLESFDLIVVGAGTAGCTAARFAASAGLKVCLIDLKDRRSIGDKVCGDAIGKHHFDELGLPYPRGDELERRIEGIEIYSPDLKTVFKVKGEGIYGFMINRHLFGQRLLKYAEDSGAELRDSTRALKPIIEGGWVRGVIAKDMKEGGKAKLQGRVVIDATGFSATIRSQLPPEMGIETEISREDVIVCYREIRELREEMDRPGYCRIYLNLKAAPGGYYWIFPEGGRKVNVGLGVALWDGHPNPKSQLYGNVLSSPLFEGSSIIHLGGGYVPTRRPLDSMVGNGIILIGDAACQVNPIHGGGMGPSMIGGRIAAETVVEALTGGDGVPSRESLWPVNVKYMRSYGAKQAGLDVFRMFLQHLSDDDLNYGMGYRLITEEDLLKVSMGGDLRLNLTEKTRRVFRGLGKLSLLRKLYHAASLLGKAKRIYYNYPSTPDDFPRWKTEVEELYSRARSLFKK